MDLKPLLFKLHCSQVNNNADTVVKMPLSQFKPYYRGKIIVDGPVLNVRNITSFGIQVAGGVYENFKQSGLSSFVVDQIWAERWWAKFQLFMSLRCSKITKYIVILLSLNRFNFFLFLKIICCTYTFIILDLKKK